MTPGLTEGSIFAGRYRIVRRIASGGMGAVYEVVHLETERRRALKVMLPHVLQSADLRERFQREAKVAAHVESDYIVDVFDAGYDAGTQMPFLVMELLRGEELGKRLKRVGRLSAAEVVAHLTQTAHALDKTHRANIVHRDLKPENLFLTERDDGPPRIKVLDFGIAKVVAESTTMGGGTQSIGTPLYMAPEQLNPHARLSGAADRYALAMVAYTLLVGSPYWAEEARAGNPLALAMVTVYGPREPASARAARMGVSLPPAFDAWFQRGAALDPEQRFPSALEMVAALSAALAAGAVVTTGAGTMAGLGPPLEEPEAATIALVPTPGAVRTPASLPAFTSAPSGPGVSRAVLAVAALAFLGAAVVGTILLTGSRRTPADAATAIAAAPPTSTASAPASPPSVAPVVEPAPTESAAAPSATVPRATPTAPRAPIAAPTAKATADAQRKKMWGRD